MLDRGDWRLIRETQTHRGGRVKTEADPGMHLRAKEPEEPREEELEPAGPILTRSPRRGPALLTP